jgi:serine/threonine-protein kinase
MSTPSVQRTSAKSHHDGDWLEAELRSALAGQFVIERMLGRGGMGVVYLARELRLDRRVAIKVLPPDLAVEPTVRERFLREARTAALLSHPNIVPVYRVDEIGDLVIIVMAFVDGPTLGARIRSAGAIPAPEAARILRGVAWALAYAHAHGVVHCDVKPDNILLDQETGRASSRISGSRGSFAGDRPTDRRRSSARRTS